MNIKTAEQYLKRYRRRGAERAPKTHDRDRGVHTPLCLPGHDHAFDSKPNHAARAVPLPLKPLAVKPRPVQPEHPVTTPLNSYQRAVNYHAQNGVGPMTARQARRIRLKAGRASTDLRSTR